MKKIDYRHYVSLGITGILILLSFLIFNPAFFRLIESLESFGRSFIYYWAKILNLSYSIELTVNDIPSGSTSLIPGTWGAFKAEFVEYWQTFATKESLIEYLVFLAKLLYVLSKVLIILIPFVLIYWVILKFFKKGQNNDYGYETLPLRIFKRFEKKVYVPVKDWLLNYVEFLKEYKRYRRIWFCIFLYAFNGFSILIEFFSFYFYFVVSFDWQFIYLQFYKLVIDLTPVITMIPFFVWGIVVLLIFLRWRKKIGYNNLWHAELRNRGYLNERPIVLMLTGTMGAKKTTTLTDFCLSTEVMFREKAYELLLKSDLKFPNFPWILFEKELQRLFFEHKLYNLSSCRSYVRNIGRMFSLVEYDLDAKRRYEKYCQKKGLQVKDFVFGYDWKRYGLFYDDGLKLEYLFEVLEDYAQLYLIYIVEGSLIVGNYSTRTDNVKIDEGNFPLWDTDFFHRNSYEIDSISRYSRILDFDMLRLGKKMIEANEKTNSFEFGIVAMTEFGKERGNSYENKEIKKESKDANPKNDMLTNRLKMARHSATVCNFPFVRFLADDQRSMSLGADARELFDIIHIRETSERKLHLPFFFFEELIYELVYPKFENWYKTYRFNRGDYTLFSYLNKKLVTILNNHYERTYNIFGYYTLKVQTESGMNEGVFKDGKIYLSTKKDYSKRFATDCFADYFASQSEDCGIGLMDYEEYACERARIDELEKQHSYFIADLLRMNTTTKNP